MATRLAEKTRWVIKERVCEDVLDQLLVNRGIDLKEKENFLDPDYEKGMHNPGLIKGMSTAVNRIMRAIKNQEKIGVFGDYDADGIPATALLFDVLEKHGLAVETFIPKRDEGYGLNKRGIDEFAEKGVKLLITVDLGVTGKKEVAYAKELGLDVIVTDHHEVIEELFPTEAICVIDPKIPDNKYPFRELSGTAVAFKLASALSAKTGKISKNQLKWYLDLVGISTFCDIVPLKDENRVLAKYGLVVLSKTKRAGLKKLYEAAGIQEAEINPYVVGFLIGPRLNAPGRMGDCSDALNLLLDNEEQELEKIAKRLEKSNSERQEILKKVFKDADEKVVNQELYKNKIIFVCGEGWPDGIVGLVAGRLLEKYRRPTIVVGYQNGIGRGSARSIDEFSMVEALNKCQAHLIKYGGHKKAAGLTIAYDQMEKFYEALLKVANAEINDDDLVVKYEIDMKLKAQEITWNLYGQLEKLEPYGLGNPRPVFATYGLECKKISTVGKSKEHVKVVLEAHGKSLNGVGFGLGGQVQINEGDLVDAVYTLDRDDWRGGRNLQLKILDIKKVE